MCFQHAILTATKTLTCSCLFPILIENRILSYCIIPLFPMLSCFHCWLMGSENFVMLANFCTHFMHSLSWSLHSLIQDLLSVTVGQAVFWELEVPIWLVEKKKGQKIGDQFASRNPTSVPKKNCLWVERIRILFIKCFKKTLHKLG